MVSVGAGFRVARAGCGVGTLAAARRGDVEILVNAACVKGCCVGLALALDRHGGGVEGGGLIDGRVRGYGRATVGHSLSLDGLGGLCLEWWWSYIDGFAFWWRGGG